MSLGGCGWSWSRRRCRSASGLRRTDLLDEGAQVQHRRVEVGTGRELVVIDRQDEGAGTALLLGEGAQVAVAGHAQHLEALGLDRLRQRADAQAGGVLGTVVFVNDDDGKTEFHDVTRVERQYKEADRTPGRRACPRPWASRARDGASVEIM